jgi:hypothetical protein
MVYPNGSNNLPMVGTVTSKTKKGILITKTSSWTQDVRNRMRQKSGEIQAFRDLESGSEKWCREHTQRNETDPISEEDQNLLEDMDRWCDPDEVSLLKEYYESRKRERIHEDGSFMHHQKGSITGNYTEDWNLREGEYRKKLGE